MRPGGSGISSPCESTKRVGLGVAPAAPGRHALGAVRVERGVATADRRQLVVAPLTPVLAVADGHLLNDDGAHGNLLAGVVHVGLAVLPAEVSVLWGLEAPDDWVFLRVDEAHLSDLTACRRPRRPPAEAAVGAGAPGGLLEIRHAHVQVVRGHPTRHPPEPQRVRLATPVDVEGLARRDDPRDRRDVQAMGEAGLVLGGDCRVVGPARSHRADGLGGRVEEHGDEARQVELGDRFVDDVGLVQARLRAGGSLVLDDDRHRARLRRGASRRRRGGRRRGRRHPGRRWSCRGHDYDCRRRGVRDGRCRLGGGCRWRRRSGRGLAARGGERDQESQRDRGQKPRTNAPDHSPPPPGAAII